MATFTKSGGSVLGRSFLNTKTGVAVVGATVTPTVAVLAEDVTVPGGWSASVGSALYATTDEPALDDTDYIQSPVAGAAASEYKARLQNQNGTPLTKPVANTPFVLNVRADENIAGGGTVRLQVKLYKPDGVTQIGNTKLVAASLTDTATTYRLVWDPTELVGTVAADWTGGPVVGFIETAVSVATVADGYILEVAFTDSPAAPSPTWTNITPYMTEVMCRHGKQRQIGTTDAGTMTVRLRNESRRFDPTHTGSPYSPNVLPLRQIRLQVTEGGVTIPLFRGYVQSWPQEPQGKTVTWTQIECVDGFLPLSRADVGEGETWPEELSGTRINRLLDAAGWPTLLRDIDTGVSLINEATIPLGSGITVLAAILEAADAELGSFFIDGQGRACFHDRHRRRRAAYLTAAATFQDGNSTGYTYQNIVLDTDDDNIWNDVQVTATGGETARAEDATSQTAYWRRSLTRQVPLARTTEAQDQAEWLLAQNKDPRGRLREVTLKPRRPEAGMFASVVGREISDHVIVKRWPQKVGTEILQHCSVESVQYHAKPGADALGDVTTTFSLSTPAPSAVDWWILGDSTYGVLGSTTKLIY